MRYAVLAAAVAFTLASCSRRENAVEKAGTTRTTGATDTSVAATPPDDAEISVRVRRSIQSDAMLASSARKVTVSTENGVVTLRGEVDDERDSAAVEQRARQTPGVLRVDNQLDLSAR
jgi:osmotically-inducible protein OsmY